MKTSSNYIKLYTSLNLSIIVVALGYLYDLTTLGNFLSLLLIFFSLFFLGKPAISLFSIFIFLVAFTLYLIEPGNLKPGVSLIPFLGLFFIAPFKSCHLQRDVRIAKMSSIINILVIHIIGFFGYNYFSVNFINTQSQLFLYLLLLNMLFFKEPFTISVILSVILPTFFSPGHSGNRSAIFLIFFLFNRIYIQKSIYYLKKKKLLLLNFTKIMISGLLLLSIVFWLINHPKFNNPDYHEVRIIWFSKMLKFAIENGIQEFINKGTNILRVTINPHNSFFWLILNDAWVGILKIIIFINSIFIIPVSAWLAVFSRANFDSFFFSGPLGIIFLLMVNTYLYYKYRFFRVQTIKFRTAGYRAVDSMASLQE